MHSNQDYTLIMAIFAIFKQLILVSYNATDRVLSFEQSLSVENMQRLQTSQVCKLHMNRICNIFQYLYENKKDSSAISKKQTFETERLITGIAENFADTVSGYAEVQVSFTAKSQTTPVLVEKTKLELAIFNLLYCSLHNIKDKGDSLKLNLYITENKEQTIFHIRDNSKIIDSEIIHHVFSGRDINFSPDSLFDSVVALSLNAAAKATADMGGTLAYSALKSGNRYDVILPKIQETEKVYAAQSIATYIPNFAYLREILASIEVEELLKDNPVTGDEL